MNKILRTFVVVFAAVLSFINTSCDKFDTLPLNIPFSVKVTIQGSDNPSQSSSTYCLVESSTYKNYVKDIKKLTFLEAAWRTDSVKNVTAGEVKVTVRIAGGATLFQKTIAGTNPAAYLSPNAPFVLTLTETEIEALNTYFNNYLQNPAQCLQATVEVTVSDGTPPYYLRGIIDMVVEGEIKL